MMALCLAVTLRAKSNWNQLAKMLEGKQILSVCFAVLPG